MLKQFQSRAYLLSEKGLLLWEPSWETFRPVKSVVWNPTHNQLEPFFDTYVHDIFDVHYGYSSEALHDYCISMTDLNAHRIEYAEEIGTIQEFWEWCKQPLQWAGDRGIHVHPCSGNIGRSAFLKRYSLHGRTLKRAPRNLRGTRKVHIHK